eukprot:scaffold7266_cov403-Prasinococcus_capsulatus_cf.AAC.11
MLRRHGFYDSSTNLREARAPWALSSARTRGSRPADTLPEEAGQSHTPSQPHRAVRCRPSARSMQWECQAPRTALLIQPHRFRLRHRSWGPHEQAARTRDSHGLLVDPAGVVAHVHNVPINPVHFPLLYLLLQHPSRLAIEVVHPQVHEHPPIVAPKGPLVQ